MDTDTSRPSLAATGDSKTVRQTPAPALAAGPFVLSGGAICAGHAAAIWLHAAHWHASPSLHRFGDLRELSVPLLSGTGSRFGTGVGEEQTASGAIDRRSPGQPVAVAPCACRLCCVACSKSIACQIYAPLGHGGPKTATVLRVAAASVPADGFSVTVPGLV